MADSFLPLLLFQRIQKRTPERCLGKLRGRDLGFGGRQWRCWRSYGALFFRLADAEEKTLVLFFSTKLIPSLLSSCFRKTATLFLKFFPGDEQPPFLAGDRFSTGGGGGGVSSSFSSFLSLSPFFPAGANGRETNGHSNKEARLPSPGWFPNQQSTSENPAQPAPRH